MSKKMLYLLGIVATILIGTWLQYIFCCDNCEEKTESKNTSNPITIEEPVSETPTQEAEMIIEGFNFKTENTSFSTSNNFKFLDSNFNLLQPISDSIDLGIENLKSSLVNSTSKFNINGLYNSTEENNSIFPNLGIARATAVKNYLISKGIPENKLQVSSSLTDEMTKSGDTLINSISYNWAEIKDNQTSNENDWNNLKVVINANPVRLYFNTGQSTINLSNSDKEKIGKIIEYTNNVPNSKILITGHTDNTTGPNNTNEYYSAKRAEFAKDYFVSNGISASKIVTEGKAATMPIADNNTEEGRAKNRRAEISIQ